jgi:hypothetical protein
MDKYSNDPNVKDWVKNHRTMVCLKATEQYIGELIENVQYEGIPVKHWHDEDLVDCVWASAAIGPFTKQSGEKHFSNLKLA